MILVEQETTAICYYCYIIQKLLRIDAVPVGPASAEFEWMIDANGFLYEGKPCLSCCLDNNNKKYNIAAELQ